MKPYQIILLTVGSFIALIITILILLLIIGLSINSTKHDEKNIVNNSGFVKAYKNSLYDGKGNKIVFKGVNLGNWFIQEPWMTVSAINGSFDNMFGYIQRDSIEAFKNNPNLNKLEVEALKQLYIETYIKENDFKILKDLGINIVRVNFTCYNATKNGYDIDPSFFNKLDWIIELASKYGLYVILDNHGAIGSQNKDNHSGDITHFELYGNKKNEEATIELWKYIANRYKDNKTVAIYDLLNEPRRAPGKFTGKKQFDFYDRLYQEIRKIDINHVIMMECFTFPFHGVSPRKYSWENIAYSYHIYNLTPFSEKFAINFYKIFNNLLRYKVPIVIGEFSCWEKKNDWYSAISTFNKLGWSHLMWTYKANRYFYSNDKNKIFPYRMWGIFESNVKPVDINSSTFEEIKQAYLQIDTSLCEKTIIYEVYKDLSNDI